MRLILNWSELREESGQRVIIGSLPDSLQVVFFGCDGKLEVEDVLFNEMVCLAHTFVIIPSESVDVNEHASVVGGNSLSSI